MKELNMVQAWFKFTLLFIFKGPTIARDINKGLIELLKRWFSNIKEAIGIEIKSKKG